MRAGYHVARLGVDGEPEEFNARNFAAVEYTDAKGERRPAYRLTRDGFTLLAMGFTGKRALAFKLAYIEAFSRMEAELRQPEAGGATRRARSLAALDIANGVACGVHQGVFEQVSFGPLHEALWQLPDDVRPLFAQAVGRMCAQAHARISLWAADRLAYGCSLDCPDGRAQRAQALLDELAFDDWLTRGEAQQLRAMLRMFDMGGQIAGEAVDRLQARLQEVGA